MSKKRILFVDDEPNVLQGLQRMLRQMRNEWDMEFAEGSEAALKCMETNQFDIIVSDMRMPGMNGAQLLKEVMKRSPTTVRLVLSGHADQELVAQCVGVAHQYISKPCEPEQLKSMIQNACFLSSGLVSEDVKKIITSIESLPSVPTLYLELKKALHNENASIQDLAKIIQKDIGMTAKILKLVNSAFFGLRRTIETAHDAMAYLGVETVKTLVLVNGIFSETAPLKTRLCTLDELWQHSMCVANAAKAIAQAEKADRKVQEEAFVGGTLHDVGILVLASNFPEAYNRIADIISREKLSLSEAEKKEFGVTHTEVGAYLLGLWGLPTPILGIVSMHHQVGFSEPSAFSALLAVHTADAISGADSPYHFMKNVPLDEAWIAKAGLESRIPEWRHIIDQPLES